MVAVPPAGEIDGATAAAAAATPPPPVGAGVFGIRMLV